MIEGKNDILAYAIENFTKFGSKRFSMDDLAKHLGISKKTLYKYFSSKEALVQESLTYYFGKILSNIDQYMLENPNNGQPLNTVIYIYKQGLMTFQELNPSFLHGLNKYYPNAYEFYSKIKSNIVWDIVNPLLKKAKELGQIRKNVNIDLVCSLFLARMEETVYSKDNLFQEYSIHELLDHIIINNLRGILTLEYLQTNPLD
ncbi:TetR/AcrR family transcriptional regulator [Flagellimonas zhangzhouensis]|uniref:Transcriptional regulator, TetR family n=1 Tax=Flagellimonas zhangzhouensis TaxID=1073328 RepID=A0A1H2V2C5_9FLAO|nr:TetR/AcrR family transcriptional regulator [Allomuricauda zhangzhouensis]SDQ11519.1 transcriptional regulator, TetR family [Allomuricauda zhangzhouensis]SDW62482.1 transcriptional regulator, TetR family [Allomuricauda zhangzhouensis]